MQIGKLYRLTDAMRLYNMTPADDAVFLKRGDVLVYLGANQKWTGSWWTHTFLAPDGNVVAWPMSTSMPIMNPVDKLRFELCK